MSHLNGSEPSRAQRETEGRWEEKNVLCDQIKEIIAALNDIRTQLAEQNKYLDVLTETYVRKPAPTHLVFAQELETGGWDEGSDWGEYVDFAQGESLPARGMNYEGNYEGNYEENSEEKCEGNYDENYDENYEEKYEGNCDGNYRERNYEEGKGHYGEEKESSKQDSLHVNETAGTREQREPILAESGDMQKQERYSLESTGPSTFYLPLGLVISLFCMRFFNAKQSAHVSQASFTTVFIILSLAAYIFATFTLWFLREEDWVKRVIGSWRLAKANATATASATASANSNANAIADSIQADHDRGSRIPDLLRGRQVLETS